jgi:hypothetical protein
LARLSPPKSAIGGRTDRKVKLGGTIKHRGQLNKIAQREHGKTYFELNDDQRHRILRQLKAQGATEGELLGKVRIQIVFRKNEPDHVKQKAEEDSKFIDRKLFPKSYIYDTENVQG